MYGNLLPAIYYGEVILYPSLSPLASSRKETTNLLLSSHKYTRSEPSSLLQVVKGTRGVVHTSPLRAGQQCPRGVLWDGRWGSPIPSPWGRTAPGALTPLPRLSLRSTEPLDGVWLPGNNSDISANLHVFLVCLQNAAQARFFVMLNLVGKLRRKTNTAQTVAKGAINTALGQWHH